MTSLNYINYLNAAASLIIGASTIDLDLGPEYDFFNKFNMREFPRRYEEGSLTPAEPFFFICNIVALFFFVFAVVQLLPAYRASPMVQDGIQYWYFVGTIAQVLGYVTGDERGEGFWRTLLSSVFFAIMSACIWKILNNQAHITTESTSEEYWILRFPFSLQAGWSIALVIMSVNVLFKGGNNNDGGFDAGAFVSGIITIISLIVYAGLVVKLLLLNGDTPNYVVPATIAIITLGIGINSRAAPGEGTWATILLTVTLFLISLGAAAGTAFLVYKNEYKAESSEIEEGTYEGAEMSSKPKPEEASIV